jgi:ATP-binding cassette subfamily B multidrug efflux pump
MPDSPAVPPSRPSAVARRGAPVAKPRDMKGALMRLWHLTRGSRRGLGWVLLASALVSLSAIVGPYLIGSVVNLVYAASPAVWAIALLAALYLFDWLMRFIQRFFMAQVGQRIILRIRTCLFDSMRTLPLSYFDRHRHGELMSRLTNDVDNISTTISDSLANLLTFGFTVLGVFGMMLFMSPPLACVSLVSIAVIGLLTDIVTRRTRRFFARQQAILGELDGHVEESISGLSMVRAFGREDDMIERFEDENEQYCRVATKALVWSGLLMPITNVVNNLSFLVIAVVAGLMTARGWMTVGAVSSFLLYSRQFTRPFVEIASIYNEFQSALAGAERVFETMDEEPEPLDRMGATCAEGVRGDIEFRETVFAYEPGHPVIRGTSFHVPAGTRAAVVGQTGSGKTTLVNLLTRFYDVDEGAILLDGRDVRDYRLRDLRSAFGVVLQDTSLFAMSVRDNIAYGRTGIPLDDIVRCAREVGADEFISRLPEGYDTVLVQEGEELSQGERQLLTIARAVLDEAPILILDEATSSVDTMTEEHIRDAVLSATRNRTSIIIAHRLSTVVDSDVILVMDGGRIVETGSHGELMAANGYYAELYRSQAGGSV